MTPSDAASWSSHDPAEDHNARDGRAGRRYYHRVMSSEPHISFEFREADKDRIDATPRSSHPPFEDRDHACDALRLGRRSRIRSAGCDREGEGSARTTTGKEAHIRGFWPRTAKWSLGRGKSSNSSARACRRAPIMERFKMCTEFHKFLPFGSSRRSVAVVCK